MSIENNPTKIEIMKMYIFIVLVIVEEFKGGEDKVFEIFI